MRFAIIGFLVLVMGAAVKAHIHFIRLALLAAMGLAGMWMMHKLAQDWQKISSSGKPAKPAAMAGKLLGLWKRSLPDEVSAKKTSTTKSLAYIYTLVQYLPVQYSKPQWYISNLNLNNIFKK